MSTNNKFHVLVIYDIVDNKRRNKFVRFLENYAIRVQKSAFEMNITKIQYDNLIKKIPYFITKEDNVRVYKLNNKTDIKSWGETVEIDNDVIII